MIESARSIDEFKPCQAHLDLHNSRIPDRVHFHIRLDKRKPLAKARGRTGRSKKKSKAKTRAVKKDPLWVDGQRPRPMYVDYKDVELLKKLVNRHGRIVGRRKTGCSSVSQHAVTEAIKRARFMALLPFKGD